jgi:hypothetical protein
MRISHLDNCIIVLKYNYAKAVLYSIQFIYIIEGREKGLVIQCMDNCTIVLLYYCPNNE